MTLPSTSFSDYAPFLRNGAILALGLINAVAFSGCSGETFTPEEKRLIGQLRLSQLPALPPDPSNAYGDDPAAAALGEMLFFDMGLSGDGTVSCATCHAPERQFQDDRARAQGVGVTDRRTMPLAGVSHGAWFFWDGRKDSLWAQALGPLEDAREHAGNRLGYARYVSDNYRKEYEVIFGPLPELSHLPSEGSPLGGGLAQASWARVADEDRIAIDQVFANLGKALAAFQRTITHEETRFDRFAEAVVAGKEPVGDAVFSSLEIEGLMLFIGKANCIDCHNGPRLTDEFFHNTGVPPVDGLPRDMGRTWAIDKVLNDPFNCYGRYSDAAREDCVELRFMAPASHEMDRAFKTPSLRGAASRPPYMHSGQIGTLDEVIDHYSRAPEAIDGHSELEGVIFTDRGKAALIAFLKTLD